MPAKPKDTDVNFACKTVIKVESKHDSKTA